MGIIWSTQLLNDPFAAVIYKKNDDGELEQIKLNWLHWLITRRSDAGTISAWLTIHQN